MINLNNTFEVDIRNLLGITEGTFIGDTFQILTDNIPLPFVGNVISSIKFNRLQKRLKKHHKEILDIGEKVSHIDDVDFLMFLKGFLFPVILEELLNEEEERKIGCFLSGFGNVIEENISSESKVLMYYDTLKSVRFLELQYLLSLVGSKRRVDSQLTRIEPNYFRENDFLEIKDVVDNKLEGLGLVNTGRLNTIEEVKEAMNDAIKSRYTPTKRSKTIITPYGKKFLKFYCLIG